MTAELVTVHQDVYHADGFRPDHPTLSASLINVLLNKSPKHAWYGHPRLNPDWQRHDDSKFDVGSAVHDVFLEGKQVVDVIDADSWRSKEAKQQRDESRALGRIPLLTDQFVQVEEIVAAIYRQLNSRTDDPRLFAGGKPEQTIVWDEDGVACRARLDYLNDDHTLISDLKTTKASANPEQWVRTMYGMGCDVQVALYRRAVASLHPERFLPPEFLYCVVEVDPPYALSVFSLGASALELADAKIDHALSIWARCLTSGEWPAYSSAVAVVEAPGWEMARWMEREARDEVAA